MFNFNLGFHLPEHWIKFKPLGLFVLYDKKISKNKSIEFQIEHFNWTHLFNLSVDFSVSGRDHPGLYIDLTVLGLSILFTYNDNRHWDYDNSQWETC